MEVGKRGDAMWLTDLVLTKPRIHVYCFAAPRLGNCFCINIKYGLPL